MSSNPLQFQPKKGIYSIVGIAFVLYALVVYPLLSKMFGHQYPDTPTFGLPCPTTIFTLGLFMFCRNGIPWYLMAVPFLWSLIGVAAAVSLSVYQDYFLGLAGILSLVLFFLAASEKASTPSSSSKDFHLRRMRK